MSDRPNTDPDQTTQDVNAILAGMARARLPPQLQPGYRTRLPYQLAQADPADPPPASDVPPATLPTPATTPSPTPGGDQPLASPTPPVPSASPTPGSNAPMLSPTPPIPTLQPPQPPQRPGQWQDRPDVPWQNRPSQQPQIPQQQQNPSEVQQRFISTYGPLAEEAGKQLGVDPRLILGQWALESGWGVGPGSAQIGNMAGIKGRDGQYVRFNSPQEFADAYTRFLRDNPRYRNAIGAGTDANKFFGGLKQAGYFQADLPGYMQGVFRNIGVFGTVAQGQGPQVQPQPSYPPAEPRESGDWGHPPPMQGGRGPDGQPMPGQLPQPSAFGRIMSGLAPLLLAIGSLALRLPLSSAITAYGAMARAQQNGEEQEYQRNRTRWRDQLGEATAQQTLESRAASDAFSEYGHNNPQGLQQQLMRVALQYNDPTMYRMAEQGDLNGIYQMQAKRDALNQDLTKMHRAADEEADRQAQNAAVKAMDQQSHDQFVKEHGQEPTPNDIALYHNENIGKAARAGTKDPKAAGASGREEVQPYDVVKKDTREPTGRKVRMGANGGLFDLNGQPTTLGPDEDVEPVARPRAAGGEDKTAGDYTWTNPDGSKGEGYARIKGNQLVDGVTEEPIPTKPGTRVNKISAQSAQQAGAAASGTPGQIEDWDGMNEGKPPPGVSNADWVQAQDWARLGRAPPGLSSRSGAYQGAHDALPYALHALGKSGADMPRDAIDYETQRTASTSTERYFTSGMGARQLTALDTVAAHIGLFREYAAAVKNGDVTAINEIAGRLATATGSPELIDMGIAGTITGDEVIRLLTQTGGSRGDREDIKERLSVYSSPEQFEGMANTLTNFVRERYDPLRQQYTNRIGATEADKARYEEAFKNKITPAARAIIEQKRPIAGQEDGQQPQQRTVQPPATLPDWAQQSGHTPDGKLVYRGKDGQTYNPDHTPYQAPR